MPKRATHTFESEKDGLKEEKLGIQYCMTCGESVLILGEQTALTDMPRRRTDGAFVLEQGSAVFKLNAQPKGTKVLKRVGGYERQHRLGCWSCGVLLAYRCEEGDDAKLTYLLADATGQQADLYLAMYHVPPCIQPAGPLSVRVALEVLTGQVRRTVVHVNESDVRVAVCAPPREGLANAELLEYMAKVLGVARSRLHLSRGWSNASKYLLVSGLQPVEIFKRLKAAIETDALIPTAAIAGAVAPPGNPDTGPAATAGAASFAARRHWEEGEELDDLATAPTKQQQTFIK